MQCDAKMKSVYILLTCSNPEHRSEDRWQFTWKQGPRLHFPQYLSGISSYVTKFWAAECNLKCHFVWFVLSQNLVTYAPSLHLTKY